MPNDAMDSQANKGRKNMQIRPRLKDPGCTNVQCMGRHRLAGFYTQDLGDRSLTKTITGTTKDPISTANRAIIEAFSFGAYSDPAAPDR